MSASPESKTPTPEPMSDERLAEIDVALDKAGDVVTEMDDYGLKANTHWIEPLVFGLLGAKELRAEVERLHTEQAAVLAALRDALGTSPATFGQAAKQAVEAVAERDDARAEMERLGAELAIQIKRADTHWEALATSQGKLQEAVGERNRLAEQLSGDRLRKVIEATLIAYWALDRERETNKLDVAEAGSHAFTIVEALRIAGLPVKGESVGVRDSVRDAVLALGGTEADR